MVPIKVDPYAQRKSIDDFRKTAVVAVVFMPANAKKVPDDLIGALGLIAKPYSQPGIVAAVRYLEECVRRPPPRFR